MIFNGKYLMGAFFLVTSVSAMEDACLRAQIKRGLMVIHAKYGCGICKKFGAEMFWFSPHSRCVHKDCYNLIALAEKDSIERLKEVKKEYPYLGSMNSIHEQVVGLVEEYLRGSGEYTMRAYCERYGILNLKRLFDLATKEFLSQSCE